MNRIKVKKMLILSLVMMLTLSILSACGNSSNSTNKPSSTDAGVPDNNNKKSDEIVELSLFIDAPWYPLNEWKGPIAEKITEKTGVKLKVTVATDDKQLPLMISSGDLPDLIFTYAQVGRLSDSSLSYPWNELIEQYTPNFVIDKIRVAIHTMDDGNFYTVRNSFATQDEMERNKYAIGSDGNPGIAIREDILEELGLPAIKSVEEFVSALSLVKNQYPELVPLTMDKDWIEQYFLQQFGVEGQLDGWYERNGEVDYIIRQPEALEYFKFINKLYRDGYILAENFAYTNAEIDDEYAVSGKAFAHAHTVSIADSNNAKLKNSDEQFTFKMLPSAISENTKIVSTGLGFAGTFITKNNKNPEASIKFIEYLASEEGRKLTMFGIEGEHWTWNEEGYPNLNFDPSDSEFVNSTGIKWWYLYNDGVMEGLQSYVPGTQKTEALLQRKAVTVYKPQIGLIQAQPDSEERTTKTKIDEMVKNEKVKIYLASTEEAAIANYEAMIRTAEQIGLNDLVSWANGIYQNKKHLFE